MVSRLPVDFSKLNMNGSNASTIIHTHTHRRQPTDYFQRALLFAT